MHLGVQHFGVVVDRWDVNGDDECSDLDRCMCCCTSCADHSDWSDCVHTEASREQEKAFGGFVSAE